MRHFRHPNHADSVQRPTTSSVRPLDLTKLRHSEEKRLERREPLISVITPTFNRESRIGRAIFSVINQTYPNIEILVCDDGSSDATLRVLDSIARKDNRLKIFQNNTNRGVSFARNKLINESRGDYVVFLDSDDELYDENVLEKISNAVLENSCDMLLTDYISAEDVGIGKFEEAVPNRSVNVRSMSGAVVNVHSQPTLIYERAFWAFVYSRHFLKTRNIRFIENLRRWEDRPFMFGALANADRIIITHIISRIRYRNNTSLMANLHGNENYGNRGPEDLRMTMTHLKATKAAFDDFQDSETASEMQKRVHLLNFGGFVERGLVDVVHLERIGVDVEVLRSQLRTFFGSVSLKRRDFRRFADVAPMRSAAAKRLYRSYRAVQCGDFDEALQRANGMIGRNLLGTDRIEKRRNLDAVRQRNAFESQLTKALKSSGIERVTLHIGFHKTGSTYIQTRLLEGREGLRKVAVLFPLSLFVERAALGLERGRRSSGHQIFVEYAKRDFDNTPNWDRASIKWAEFIREIETSNSKHILLSAENLCFGLGVEKLRRLQEELSPVRVKVLCMVRNPAEWLESYYKEMVTGGWFRETRRLTELLVPDGERLIDFYARLQPWREVFGGENVSAMAYEYGAASGLSLEECFLREIGIDLESSKSGSVSERANISFDRLETEAVRIFNSCCSTLCYSTEEYRQSLHKLLNGLATLGSNGDSCSILSPQSKQRIVCGWDEVGRNLVREGVLPEQHLDYMLRGKLEPNEWVPLDAMPLKYLDYVFRCVPNNVDRNVMRRSRLLRIRKALSFSLFRKLARRA